MLLKNRKDIEREIKDFEYYIRILSQREGGTGIGVIKGNSLDSKQLERNISGCEELSKVNTGPKYHFPDTSNPPKMSTAEDKLIKNPITVKNDLVEELISNCADQSNVEAPFGRFRAHIHHNFLRNNNDVDLYSLKTFYFIELSLKAEKSGSLSEFWNVSYYKKDLILQQLFLFEFYLFFSLFLKNVYNLKNYPHFLKYYNAVLIYLNSIALYLLNGFYFLYIL